MTWERQQGVFALGDLPVERGGVIRDARVAWATHGTLSPARDNVVVYPCSYGATHEDLAELVGPDSVLDPTRWFVVIPDMFGNGRSSSPSDTDTSADTSATGPDYPSLVTVRDNVAAQRRLLSEQFGVSRVAAVYGFSMGALQAYHWASMYPDDVARAIVVCGSSRTAVHNRVFLSGLLRILEAAPEHLGGGRFTAEPVAAVRAFAHVYAGWGLSQDFYRAGLYQSVLGYPDLDAYLQTDWVDGFAAAHAADLYAQARTWSAADIAADPRYHGDLERALAGIRARVLLLPSATDLYFRVADNEADLPHLADAELRVIPTIWGHRAGFPAGLPEELDFVRTAVREWLDS